MKKLTAIFLAILLAFSCMGIFAGCQGTPSDGKTETTAETKKETGTESGSSAETGSETGSETESETESESATETGTDEVCEHTYEVTETADATCADDAYTVYTCSICGDSYRVVSEGTATGAHTYDSYTRTEDGTANKVCSVCGDLLPVTEQEVLEAIYGAMPEFSLPNYAFIFGSPSSTEYFEDKITLLKQAGITGVVPSTFFFGSTGIDELLTLCTEMDFDVFIEMHADGSLQFAEYAVQQLYFYWLSEEYDCIRGVYLRDEPLLDLFEGLGQTADRIREEFGEEIADWKIGINLFPDCGAYEDFREALIASVEQAHSDYLLFDHYPWDCNMVHQNDSPHNYVGSLLTAKQVADEYGVSLYTFVLTTETFGYTTPTLEQIRLSYHLSLACGAEAFFLFTGVEGFGFNGLISDDGKQINPVYYSVQEVLGEIDAMKGIFSQFDLENVMVINNDRYEYSINYYNCDDYLTDSFGRVSSVETDLPCFIGCMKDAEGRDGLYLVNTEYLSSDGFGTCTLHFTEPTAYQIWSKDGLSEIGFTDTLEVQLDISQGVFIVLGGDNLPD